MAKFENRTICTCSKALDCSSIRVAFEPRRAENTLGSESGCGLDHHKFGWRQRDGGDFLANPFHPGMAAREEKRHIRAQRQRQSAQVLRWQSHAPKALQRQQATRGVRRS